MLSTSSSQSRSLWLSFPGLIALLLVALPTVAIASDSIELPQADGSRLRIESPATRLITLSPHLTELVYAAGAGHLLAATVAYSEYPPEAVDLPRVGDAFRVDTERIHLLSPDLILAWKTGNSAAAISQLTELGFAVWSIEIRQPDEIATAIEDIGKATGTSSSATIAANSIRFKIKTLRSSYAQAEQVSYFYQVASQPLFTVNGEHLISHGLNLCGGYNVFAELPTLAPQIGREAVLMADPDVLIAPNIEGHPDPLAHWQSWPGIRAVSQENYILLPADQISRATPRFVDAVELACTMMDDLRIN